MKLCVSNSRFGMSYGRTPNSPSVEIEPDIYQIWVPGIAILRRPLYWAPTSDMAYAVPGVPGYHTTLELARQRRDELRGQDHA